MERIANYVSVIKAFRLSDDDNIQWKIREYYDAVDMFMFDTEGVGYGGTGKSSTGSCSKRRISANLFFLAAELPLLMEKTLMRFKMSRWRKIFAIDINSKFEVVPGVKDMEKIKNFVTQVKA